MGALQTLPQKQQTANTSVAILEVMDALKLNVEIQYIVKLHLPDGIILTYQLFHALVNILG